MCPPLASPENGKLLSTKNAYHFGDIVQFQCDFGFIMSGFSSLLCTSSGTWNGTAPECQCKFLIIIKPDQPNNQIKHLTNNISQDRLKLCYYLHRCSLRNTIGRQK